MARTPKEKRYQAIVNAGLKLLYEQLGYLQSDVLGKLRTLRHEISSASLSNIKNDKPVGIGTLEMAGKGIQLLIEQELDMAYDETASNFTAKNTPGWQQVVVPEKQDHANQGIKVYAEGRATVAQKTAFFANAKQELVEVGIRLNSFSTYFISQSDSAYKQHILNLLQRGVHIKGYLLDPDCEQARIYFEDRAATLDTENRSLDKIREVMADLRHLCAQFKLMNLPGTFEIYVYQHIPYSLYLIVDGDSDDGKMMVSPYLYGIRRANCPVLEFSKKDQETMYNRYLEAYKAFTQSARLLV